MIYKFHLIKLTLKKKRGCRETIQGLEYIIYRESLT